jgi:uncharacterized membrane protein HdeD (DUF308 family)
MSESEMNPQPQAENQNTGANEPEEVHSFSVKYWWLNFVRGFAALGIGIGLLLPVEVFFEVAFVQTLLFQFIGIYFLVSGIMSLIWGYSNRRQSGLWLLAGVLGVTGGIIFLLRSVLEDALSTELLTVVFGVILLLTGLIHFLGGFRLSETYGRRWSLGHEFLGLVEMGIGILIFVSLLVDVEYLRLFLSVWGLIAGIGLIADGIRMRNLRKSLQAPPASQSLESGPIDQRDTTT